MRIAPAHAPIAAGFVFAALSVVAAGFATVTHQRAGLPPSASVVAERALVFADQPDGGVAVLDTAGHPIEHVTGEAGFLRGTLRSFGRDRHYDGVGPATPLRLTRWSDGRLTLDDDATNRHIELSAFGADNAKVFAAMLYKEAP